MGLTIKNNVEIEKQEAFKIFAKDKEGNLVSAFFMCLKKGLHYPSNERIRVDDEETGFFAFKDFDRAVSLAIQGKRSWSTGYGQNRHWDFSTSRLIVLPVTMYEVYAQGDFHVPSGDNQVMDGYYPAFESKEIVVHDTPENVMAFHDAVIAKVIKNQRYHMTPVEKLAFETRLPQYVA